MLDLRLEYLGEGKFRAKNKLDYEIADGELTPGETVRCKTTKQRGIRQNRLFHAIIEAAFDNKRGGPGPEQIPTWRHLKSWILCEIGHCKITVFPAGAATREFVRALREAHDNTHFSMRQGTGEIVMREALSTAKLSQEEFSVIVDKTLAIICQRIVPGADPLALRRAATERMGVEE